MELHTHGVVFRLRYVTQDSARFLQPQFTRLGTPMARTTAMHLAAVLSTLEQSVNEADRVTYVVAELPVRPVRALH